MTETITLYLGGGGVEFQMPLMPLIHKWFFNTLWKKMRQLSWQNRLQLDQYSALMKWLVTNVVLLFIYILQGTWKSLVMKFGCCYCNVVVMVISGAHKLVRDFHPLVIHIRLISPCFNRARYPDSACMQSEVFSQLTSTIFENI